MATTIRVRLAHLSDLRFGSVAPAVRAALLGELQTHPPDLAVVSGNLTRHGRRDELSEARGFLQALPVQHWLAVPGELDLPRVDVISRLIRPYQAYQAQVSTDLEPEYADGSVAVIGVNTTTRLRGAGGPLRSRHIERVARRLQSLDSVFRVVVAHHPLAADGMTPAHGADVPDRWIKAGMDLLLCAPLRPPSCQEVYSSDHRDSCVLLQAGNVIARGVRDAGAKSYHTVTLLRTDSERRMSIERRDYDEASGRFVLARRFVAWSMMNRTRTGVNGWRLMAETDL